MQSSIHQIFVSFVLLRPPDVTCGCSTGQCVCILELSSFVHVFLQAKMMSSCEFARREMIAAGAVKTFFELVCDQSNELMQTLCTAVIHTLLSDAEAVRRASKCRAAETMLQVLRQNADNEFWNQRALVLSICSRLLFNRLCGLVFVYGGLMCVFSNVQIWSLFMQFMQMLAGTLCSNFIPKQFEW